MVTPFDSERKVRRMTSGAWVLGGVCEEEWVMVSNKFIRGGFLMGGSV